MPLPATAELKQVFDRDGCIVVPGFLNGDELAELESRTQAYLRRLPAGKKMYRGLLKNLHLDDPWFADQITDGRCAKLVRALLADDLEPATAAFFDRLPNEQVAITPHFDAYGHRRRGATIWVALDKADVGNGCMRYARGSHRERFENSLDLQGFCDETPGVFPVELVPGDAAVHSTLLVHWSVPNPGTRPRRAVSYFYWAASSKGDPS